MRERIAYIRKRAQRKARKYCKYGSWTNEELSQLDYTLRTSVANAQAEIARLDSTVEWEDSQGFRKFYSELVWRPELDVAHPRYAEFLTDFFQDLPA